jgi:hypothetical protein
MKRQVFENSDIVVSGCFLIKRGKTVSGRRVRRYAQAIYTELLTDSVDKAFGQLSAR